MRDPPLPVLRPPIVYRFDGRVPALNTDPAFIQDMADMVVEALALPTLTVSEVRGGLLLLKKLRRKGKTSKKWRLRIL